MSEIGLTNTDTDAYEKEHVVYWNLDGTLFWDKKQKKKIFCPVHRRTQLYLDWEIQPCKDEFTLVRKHTRCSKCDNEKR